jgi:GH15 family glucan-1,4-alpha-glucosidase
VGNFPQAFTHIGLIVAALSLAEAETRRRRRAEAGSA